MKKSIILPNVFLFLLLSFGSSLSAQITDIVIDDQLEVIDDATKEKLIAKLTDQGITVHEQVVYAKRCEYYYIVLINTGVKDRIQLRNCKERILQAKDLESMVKKLGSVEKSIILASNFNDLIEKANKNPQTPGTTYAPDTTSEVPEYFQRQINEHNTRYLFSPSAFNLRKAELYYNTVAFAVHDIQLGITDNISIGMGTSLALTPLYVTPKISFELDEKNRISVGDLFLAGTYNNDFMANLAYANYTYGTPNNNFTLSAGLVSYEAQNQPLAHMAAMTQISRHLFFVTEHYFFRLDGEKYMYKPPTVPGTGESVTLDILDNYAIGHLGVRYVNKEVDTRSWHFGIAYFYTFEQAIDQQKYVGFSNTERQDNFIILPSVAFTYKIGKKM